MSELALLGGPKTVTKSLALYSSYGDEEVRAATDAIKSGVLSQFLGCWDENDFYGGSRVKALEKAWSDHFGVKHAVSVNSATSGLMAAAGAIAIEPGDEVIVSPWTMSATAMAVVLWGGIPVFADIDPKTFTLDVESVRKNLSNRTKAIFVTDLFGQAGALDELMALARERGLKVVEDAAQAPGARYRHSFVGTIADIGIFSLNYHKHIHTGEGGVAVTNDETLAEKMQLIRNHAESVVGDKGITDLTNMVGFNFRMGEIEAAMAMEQLKKLPSLVKSRQAVAAKLNAALGELEGLQVPHVPENQDHVYYTYPMVLDVERLGVSKFKIAEALAAEGVEVSAGYVKIHRLPIFEKKIAFGSKGYPWSEASREVRYGDGVCPVADQLNDKSFINLETCRFALGDSDSDLLIAAFKKVWKSLGELKG